MSKKEAKISKKTQENKDLPRLIPNPPMAGDGLGFINERFWDDEFGLLSVDTFTFFYIC